VSLTVPVGARFQFRNHSNEMLQIIVVTFFPHPAKAKHFAAAGP
jgi:mannose-6-phosphate isomerase-like protein (cupin superfamily)